MELLKQIQPLKVKDIIGNKIQIKHFQEILKDENVLSKIVLIIGPDGSCKTTLCNLILNELEFNVLDIKKNNYTIKELGAIISSFLCNKTITSFFNKKRKCVFIDNIDILFNTDRSVISVLEEIYPLFEKYKVFLVITCKCNEERKIIEFKNKVEIIKINHPSIKDTFAFLSNSNDQLKLNIDYDYLLKIVNKYKGSIRDTILNLYTNDTEISINNVFKDMTQFEIIKKIYRKNHSIDEIIYLLKDDMNMVSYLLYENCPDELSSNFDLKVSKNNILDIYIQINNTYLNSSKLEDYMYRNSEWLLYTLIQILKLQGVNIILKELKRKSIIKDVKYRFSQIISKISHKNIMNKKIKGIYRNNHNIDIYEIIALADKISIDKNINTNGTRKKKKYDMDECNFINTYHKYFE